MTDQVNAMMVPIHLDVLFLKTELSVLEPMADFSRLPYTTAAGDVNADVANLSEEILSQPFYDKGFQLRPGIHLHWALPDALHRGSSHGLLFTTPLEADWISALDAKAVHKDFHEFFHKQHFPLSKKFAVDVVQPGKRWAVQDVDNGRIYSVRLANHWKHQDGSLGSEQCRRLNIYGSQITFPHVPNRWLITRRQNSKKPKQWVLESDFLYSPDIVPPTIAVTYPYSDDTTAQPFRYLGRVLDLDTWHKERQEPASYLEKLTAVGYGEPNFAAFYPNCHSVFGFHDPDISEDEIDTLSYEIAGWYSQPENDYLNTAMFGDSVAATLTRYGLDPSESEENTQALQDRYQDILFETLENQAGWKAENKNEEGFPSSTICYARVMVDCEHFDFNTSAARHADAHKVHVAIGNTGTEALSAYLAAQLSDAKWEKWQIEDQLEAVHLDTLLDEYHLDIGPKFRAERHRREFSAVSGGAHWIVKQAGASRSKDEDATPQLDLDADIAQSLDQLNRIQSEYDKLNQRVESQRKQLFADWCKYMERAYPTIGDEINQEPRIHEVRAFIENHGINPIEIDSARLETLQQRRIELVNELNQVLGQFNNKHPKNADYELKSSPAPRYWQANDPVVLIAGEAANPTPRHGEDGNLACQIKSFAAIPLEDQFETLAKIVADLTSQPGEEGHLCCEQPWHPFLLEWVADVHPLKNRANVDSDSRRYKPEFIASNYKFTDKGVDLRLSNPDESFFLEQPNSYSGRSILTPYASTQLGRQLEVYLQRQLLPEYYKANQILPQDSTGENPDISFKQIVAWYEEQHESEKNAVTDSLINAYKLLQMKDGSSQLLCLTQALTGFNEALLMHKQTLQLPVDDPLGFEGDREFGARVAESVQNMNRSMPQPNNEFLPIRSGLLHVAKLRIVDTFGRVQNLDFDKHKSIRSDAMAVGHLPDLAQLRPRLTQPARLNFRWLSALPMQGAELESNSHANTSPVCGWIVPNHLDRSLMVYSAAGQALGSIANTAVWHDAPGEPRIAPWQIKNPHLCRLVCHLLKHDMDAFLPKLDEQLNRINPQWFAQHEALSILMGRPLVVTRARLGLELQGLAAVNQQDSVFLTDLQKKPGLDREHDGFTQVRFPIRVGDFGQLNDGLVAYWREQQGEDGSCHLPDTANYSSDYTSLEMSLDDDPQTLTMLLDPCGEIHASSGILPTKSINIPHDQYADILNKLNITFRTAPLLSSKSNLRIPLPEEPGSAWNWLENFAGEWEETDTIVRPKLDAHWEEPQAILQGWLKLSYKDKK
jgi:hypothetical protein